MLPAVSGEDGSIAICSLISQCPLFASADRRRMLLIDSPHSLLYNESGFTTSSSWEDFPTWKQQGKRVPVGYANGC